MAGNAKRRSTYGTKIKNQSHSISELYALAGIKNAPLSSTMSFGVAGGSSTPSGIETQGRLKTSGDSMVGAIAYYPKIAVIDGSGAIDVERSNELGDLTDDYTTYLIVTPVGSADDLDTISNPSNAGQLIHLEANTTGTITLKHNTGNIFIPSESDHTISAGGFATLIYDVAIHTDKWVLVSSSESGSSWVGTATSDLDMDTYDITDVCRIEFDQGGDTIDDSVAGIDSSSDKIRFNVPSGDHFHFTVDGDDEVKIDGTDFGIWGYLKFNSHTDGTNQPATTSDGFITIKIGTSLRKLYFYT